jgi:hypothetical protein
VGLVRRSAGVAVCAVLAMTGAASAAAPYPPPSRGSAQVVPSHIKVGDCAVFSGDGFFPLTPVQIADNGVSAGTVTATSSGTFSERLCYSTSAKKGRHTLTGDGTGADGAPLTVSAVLIVEGGRQSNANPATRPGGSASQNGGAVLGITSPQAALAGASEHAQAPLPFTPEPDSVVAAGNEGVLRAMAMCAGLGLSFVCALVLLLLLRRGHDGRRRAPAASA